MANTYSRIYIQIVFAVKYRKCLIAPRWEDELHKYISGLVTRKGQKLLAINSMPDHIHILIGMKPNCCLSELVREIKKASTEFINKNNWVPEKFQWQSGFGAFSYDYSGLDRVVKYVRNQKQHHQKVSFRDEYRNVLNDFLIECQQEYLFHEPE